VTARFLWRVYCLRYTPRRWAMNYLLRLSAKELSGSATSSGITIDDDHAIMHIQVWKKLQTNEIGRITR
jgi:hypothetical protein